MSKLLRINDERIVLTGIRDKIDPNLSICDFRELCSKELLDLAQLGITKESMSTYYIIKEIDDRHYVRMSARYQKAIRRAYDYEGWVIDIAYAENGSGGVRSVTSVCEAIRIWNELVNG